MDAQGEVAVADEFEGQDSGSVLGGDPVLVTYRYLRLAIIASVAFLFAGVAVAMTQVGVLSSISAYYYTDSQTVFVGAIVAGSLGLLAVRGRPGWENVLLNLAAMLLPLVPIIPTAIKPDNAPKTIPKFSCDGADKCIPASLDQVVTDGLLAWVIVLGLVLVVAAWTWLTQTMSNSAEGLGLLLSAAALSVIVGMYWVGEALGWGTRDVFLRGAHNFAAIGGFGCLCLVSAINAVRTNKTLTILGTETGFRSWYQWVTALMAFSLVATVIVALSGSAPPWLVFWIETVLLVFFGLFWALQTKEFWYEGVPIEVWTQSLLTPDPT